MLAGRKNQPITKQDLQATIGRINNPDKPKLVHSVSEMTVWRIEHPESGRGPFTHESRRGFASDAMVCLTEPIEHGYRGIGQHYGFNSVKAMLMSIERLTLLHEHGFHIQTYKSTDHTVLPDGQVAFLKSKAELLESVPVKEFPFRNHF